jgi:hypothetical protein
MLSLFCTWNCLYDSVCHCSEHETVSTIQQNCFNDTEEHNTLHTCWNTNEHTIGNIFGKITVYITDDFIMSTMIQNIWYSASYILGRSEIGWYSWCHTRLSAAFHKWHRLNWFSLHLLIHCPKCNWGNLGLK